MENRGRTLSVDFANAVGRTVKAQPLTAIDYGQILEIHGLPLPPSFECHFSKNGATAYKSIGTTTNGVGTVPFIDEQTQSGGIITAYIYLHETADDGETEYRIIIPVESRPGVTPAEPTPVQQDVIAQAISALNNAVTTTTANVAITEANKQATQQSAEEAEADANRADLAWNGAVIAQNSAQASADTASQKADEASVSAQSAHNYSEYAHSYALGAEQDAQSAEQSATSAQASATSAQQSASLAQQYANTATAKASEATQSAQSASQSAQTATQSAQSAQNSATQAYTYATNASASATSATASEASASASATSAQESAESAQASADRAEQEADRWYEFLPVDTASGSLAHFTDGAKDVPVKSLSVSLEPIQDLHGQSSPYPAGGGGNLVDFDEVVTAVVDTPLVQLTAGTYYLYVANEKTMAFNSYAQYSTDGTTFANISTSSEGVDVYTNQVMNYNTKKCILTVVNPVYVRVRIQTNANLSGATVKVLLTKDSTNYSVIPNAVYSTNADFQAIYKPYSNICPITGHTQVVVNRTGINVWDEEWELGTIDINGNDVANTGMYRTKGYIPVDGSIYFYNGNSDTIGVRYYDEFKNYIGRSSLVGVSRELAYGTSWLPTGTAYMRFANTSTPTYANNISINYPSTDHDYHPAQIQSITIPLGDTVYGGTLDVTQGVLTVDRKYALCTNFRAESQYDVGTSKMFSHAGFTDAKSATTPNANSSSLTDKLPWDTSMLTKDRIGFYVAYGRLWARIPNITTLEDFNTAIGGELTCVYPLATPITVPLTANQMTTLLGINNLWSDSGDVTVDYRADVQLYIQKMIANALNA